jgi:hypothetical protein
MPLNLSILGQKCMDTYLLQCGSGYLPDALCDVGQVACGPVVLCAVGKYEIHVLNKRLSVLILVALSFLQNTNTYIFNNRGGRGGSVVERLPRGRNIVGSNLTITRCHHVESLSKTLYP